MGVERGGVLLDEYRHCCKKGQRKIKAFFPLSNQHLLSLFRRKFV
jgi:hypothetical protein